MVSFSGIEIESDEIVELLKREVRLREFCQKLIYQRIVAATVEERAVTVNSEEIQAEADQFRHQHRLETAAATYTWLARECITPEEWEAGIRDRLLSQKLSKHLFGADVETYFVQHRIEFEQVSLYRIVVPYESLAYELFYQINEDEISFYEAAHLYDVDEQRRLQCGYIGKLHRWDLKSDVAASVFAAQSGDVIGPFQSEQGYELLMLESFIPAELTPNLYQEMLDQLFQEWLLNELNYLIHRNSSPTSSVNLNHP
jgi:parvulin-like peptidyl-prolyl isomerase